MDNLFLQNGGTKATIIENFRGKCMIIYPGFKKEFDSLEEAKEFVARKKLEVNISFVKGSKAARDLLEIGKG